MRHVGPAYAIILLLASTQARSEALIIDVVKQEPRRAGKARPAAKRLAEVKLVLSDSETSRNLAPALIKQLTDYGYDAAPEAEYGPLEEIKGTMAALRFELLRAGESCFINGKAVAPGSETSFWRWETSDDTLPCATQLKQAIDAFAKAKPPASPKVPLPSSDAPSDSAAAPPAPVIALVPAPAAPAPQQPVAATPEPTAPAAPRQPAPPRLEGTAPIAPPDPVDVPTFGEEGEKKACGCSSSGAPANLAGLVLLSASLLRRRRLHS